MFIALPTMWTLYQIATDTPPDERLTKYLRVSGLSSFHIARGYGMVLGFIVFAATAIASAAVTHDLELAAGVVGLVGAFSSALLWTTVIENLALSATIRRSATPLARWLFRLSAASKGVFLGLLAATTLQYFQYAGDLPRHAAMPVIVAALTSTGAKSARDMIFAFISHNLLPAGEP
jgi:hypothetical protein